MISIKFILQFLRFTIIVNASIILQIPIIFMSEMNKIKKLK